MRGGEYKDLERGGELEMTSDDASCVQLEEWERRETEVGSG